MLISCFSNSAMVAKENDPESVLEDNTDLQDLDEAEETLSLCDLPIYNDAAEWEDFSKEEDRNSLEDQDFFEFFSEDFTASTCPEKSIIFCGKLIPYKEPVSEETQMLQNNTEQYYPKKRGLFQWKSKSFNKSKRTSRSDSVKNQCMDNNLTNQSKLQRVWSSKSPALPASEKYRYRYTSSSKSRRHLFMFGLMRLPAEMELSDIKNRQDRRNPSTTLFRSFTGGEEVTAGKSRGKGFWRLLSSAFGCRTYRANAVLEASFRCFPRV